MTTHAPAARLCPEPDAPSAAGGAGPAAGAGPEERPGDRQAAAAAAAPEPAGTPAGAPAGATGPLRVLRLLVLLLALGLLTLLWGLPAWGATDAVVLQRGARLFDKHCVGCHINGGNVIRRNKTLRRQDLLRQGIDSPGEIARIASDGKGQMSGYGTVLGEGGAEAVGAWVWRQAELGWPRR